ncbi:hypothetical protein B0H17DRAFT_1128307 [Mycena rosella]|uniref:Uncharacterized protein n=1 Tax=Mycena rosella TaxID=1033263 RepID=A0AAD7GM52_MYCRO|nr:hypothetical protein B0H17DRAFT_1128307 [Mycena rosella]
MHAGHAPFGFHADLELFKATLYGLPHQLPCIDLAREMECAAEGLGGSDVNAGAGNVSCLSAEGRRSHLGARSGSVPPQRSYRTKRGQEFDHGPSVRRQWRTPLRSVVRRGVHHRLATEQGLCRGVEPSRAAARAKQSRDVASPSSAWVEISGRGCNRCVVITANATIRVNHHFSNGHEKGWRRPPEVDVITRNMSGDIRGSSEKQGVGGEEVAQFEVRFTHLCFCPRVPVHMVRVGIHNDKDVRGGVQLTKNLAEDIYTGSSNTIVVEIHDRHFTSAEREFHRDNVTRVGEIRSRTDSARRDGGGFDVYGNTMISDIIWTDYVEAFGTRQNFQGVPRFPQVDLDKFYHLDGWDQWGVSFVEVGGSEETKETEEDVSSSLVSWTAR